MRWDSSTIEVYTTERAVVIYLAVVLPVYGGCGITLLRRKALSYGFAPALPFFITIVGLTVIGQKSLFILKLLSLRPMT